MQADPPADGDRAPLHAALLRRVAADLDRISARVAADVAGQRESVAAVLPEVRASVGQLVDALARGAEPSTEVLARLRDEGADAARGGVSVERVIDRYLSAGWVLWDAATAMAGEPGELAALGAALLRTGDLAAAAIAEGHGSADREIAGRQGAVRGELLGDLLDLVPADAEGAARLGRRGIAAGFDPDVAHAVVVASPVGLPIEAGTIETGLGRLDRIDRRSAGSVLVGTRHERLVAVAAVGPPAARVIDALRDPLAAGWTAVRAEAGPGVSTIGPAYVDAVSALAVAARLGRTGQLVEAADVLVERAIGADERLLATLVEHELGPLLRAGRGSTDLLVTLDAWLDAGLNAQAAARALDLAPRTVAYRLDRISRLLGRRLDGPTVRRLGVALTGRRLLVGSAATVAPVTAPGRGG